MTILRDLSFFLCSNVFICIQRCVAASHPPLELTCLWLDSLCLTTFITQPDSVSRTDKVTFLCLSLINMLWLAEQSHRQNETCRISGASKWVSCVDRKWGFLWGQCIDFLPCHVWECTEKSSFLLRRMPCQLSDSISSQLLLWEILNITVCRNLFKLFPDVEIVGYISVEISRCCDSRERHIEVMDQ